MYGGPNPTKDLARGLGMMESAVRSRVALACRKLLNFDFDRMVRALVITRLHLPTTFYFLLTTCFHETFFCSTMLSIERP